MSEPLMLLTARGARHLRQTWQRSEGSELSAEHVAEADAVWDPTPLREQIAALPSSDQARAFLDVNLAPVLHQVLAVDRTLARDPRLWHWLAAGPLRGWMVRRWPVTASDARIGRYLGDLAEHGLGRLWWAAELTVSEAGSYIETRRLVRAQRLMERVLRSGLGRNRTVLLGILDAMHGERDRARIDRAIRALGAWSATVCLDGLDRTEVSELVRRSLGVVSE